MSEPRSAVYQKTGAIFGMAAPVIAFICITIAIASYPTFSWTNNALSDLGIIPDITGPLFNFGLYTSGLSAFIFAIFGLFTYFKESWIGKSGSAVFASATLALFAIGVFNENFSPTHYLVSVLFFTLAPISLFILTWAFWLANHRGMAIFTVLVGIIAALPWLLLFAFNYAPNVAIPELVSGLAVSAWAIIFCNKLLNP